MGEDPVDVSDEDDDDDDEHDDEDSEDHDDEEEDDQDYDSEDANLTEDQMQNLIERYGKEFGIDFSSSGDDEDVSEAYQPEPTSPPRTKLTVDPPSPRPEE